MSIRLTAVALCFIGVLAGSAEPVAAFQPGAMLHPASQPAVTVVALAPAPAGWIPWDYSNITTKTKCEARINQLVRDYSIPRSNWNCYDSKTMVGYWWVYIKQGVALA